MLATQTLPQSQPRTMKVASTGELPFGLTAKDLVLGAIGRLGVSGGVGHVLEYAGHAIEALSMEGRMTVCNMSIEAGARARDDCAGRDDVRLSRGTPRGAEGRRLGAGARPLARAALGRGGGVRRRARDRRLGAQAAGHVGHEPGHGRAGGRHGAGPLGLRGRLRAGGGRARAPLHGPPAGNTAAGGAHRPRLHRLVHECADRGPARRSGGRLAGGRWPTACARWSCRARRR